MRFRTWDLAGNAGQLGAQDILVVSTRAGHRSADDLDHVQRGGVLGRGYSQAVTVRLAAVDGRGTGVDKIYFTTDGSVPHLTSRQYTAPFEIQESTTFRFFATDRSGQCRDAAEAQRDPDHAVARYGSR